ncbi:MAG: acyl-CoA carboxylase subunit epsilon, partial [Nocardioidaceae bacterium]|nr:acyl-CoA carboxylase subunit epsilon [Nocardioidaceae bacterium]
APTVEELAALVAVVAARLGVGGAAAPADGPRSSWSAPARRVRGPHSHGPGGWRSSALPC